MIFANSLIRGLKAFNISTTPEQVDKCKIYSDLIQEVNERINLTRILEPHQMAIKHFTDSAAVLSFNLIPTRGRVLDLGTGAGFPGMVLKIMEPLIKVTLVDALAKRIKFLEQVIDELKLTDIMPLHARAEVVAHNREQREKYDIVTNRAVASLPVLIEITLPFVKIGGKVICWKGPGVHDEIKQSQAALKAIGGHIEKTIEYSLPEDLGERVIVVIAKDKKTPKEYPRRPDIIRNKPIIE